MTEPRKRGRKPGFKESEPRAGSLQARLTALEPGAVDSPMPLLVRVQRVT